MEPLLILISLLTGICGISSDISVVIGGIVVETINNSILTNRIIKNEAINSTILSGVAANIGILGLICCGVGVVVDSGTVYLFSVSFNVSATGNLCYGIFVNFGLLLIYHFFSLFPPFFFCTCC